MEKKIDGRTKQARADRPVRVPIGTRNKLRYPERKGYVRRVVSDADDRIEMFQNAGWKVVEGKDPGGDPGVGDASQLTMTTSKPVGGGITGVLMEIPESFYEEDQAVKQKRIDRIEDSMRGDGKTEGQYGKVEIA
ncbi:MAG: hypothetical protein U9N82_03440 [Thermodesulfobacteriota bacterium]|nr:hypothetical protein [Thermodesulfobacteriota bacterium]